MLFNEPKLLKLIERFHKVLIRSRFSALQRAEIAEMVNAKRLGVVNLCVSVLFNEPKLLKYNADLRSERLLNEFQCSSTSRNC